MAQKLFKTGEFAQLCGTTKDTLFHYDRLGLLKPAQTLPNGYRCYALHQLYMFDLISTLKEAGLSLHEILHYMQRRNTDSFISILKEKDKILKQEVDRLVRRRRLLRNTLRLAEISLEVEEDSISLHECGEMYFIMSEKVTTLWDKAAFEILGRHLDYCTKHNYYDDFITGELIPEENLQEHSPIASYLTSRIQKPVNSKLLHIRPAGLYAIKYIRNSYTHLWEEYRRFYHELQERGLRTTGPLYQKDITSYLSEQDATDYLMAMEIQVLPPQQK